METLGRYVRDVTEGMYVRAWDGEMRRVVEAPTTDALGLVTIRFDDGTATVLRPGAVVVTASTES